MAFTIGGLLEAVLLVVNAMAILQDYSPPLTGKPPPEDKKGVKRFLALRGWTEADDTSVKGKLIQVINSIRTIARYPLILINGLYIVYLLLVG